MNFFQMISDSIHQFEPKRKGQSGKARLIREICLGGKYTKGEGWLICLSRESDLTNPPLYIPSSFLAKYYILMRQIPLIIRLKIIKQGYMRMSIRLARRFSQSFPSSVPTFQKGSLYRIMQPGLRKQPKIFDSSVGMNLKIVTKHQSWSTPIFCRELRTQHLLCGRNSDSHVNRREGKLGMCCRRPTHGLSCFQDTQCAWGIETDRSNAV